VSRKGVSIVAGTVIIVLTGFALYFARQPETIRKRERTYAFTTSESALSSNCQSESIQGQARAQAFATPEWKFPSSRLLIRHIENGDLLIRGMTGLEEIYYRDHVPVPSTATDVNRVTYKYRSASKALEAIALSAWEAEGVLCDCFDLWGIDHTLRPFSVQNGLVYKEQAVPTAGHHQAGACDSPTGRYIAVLSANGAMRGTGTLFVVGSGKYATGPYYQEVFSKTDGSRASGPVELVLDGDVRPTRPCWSGDERYLVYQGSRPDRIWIVESGLSAAKESNDAQNVRGK
jgi:hypothetical protein